MTSTRTAMILAAFLGMTLVASGAGAAGVQSKCLVAKNKCVSKKMGSLLKCHEKSETPGKSNDPNDGMCLGKAMDKFNGADGCFLKAQAKGPDCIPDAGVLTVEVAADLCVDQLVEGIDPGPVTQTKCGVGKKKCVAKLLKSILKCYEKAETPGKSTNPNESDCLTKAEAKYNGGTDASKGCFVKLETKAGNDCAPPTGNQADLQGIVEGSSCVGAILDDLGDPTTSTTTSTTSTTAAPTTTTSTTAAPTTTTSTTAAPTTTTSTTTTTTVPSPTILDFTSTTGTGNCGDTRDGSSVVLKTLGCGKLYLGGANSSLTPNDTPDGAVNRFALSCAGSSCTISPTSTAPPLNSSAADCTNTGCNFGTPLPVPASSATCVLNTFATPAGGTLNLATGATSQTINLNSAVFLSGNLTHPCPQCSATGTPSSPGTGTCNRGPRAGLTCVTTNSTGLTRDCPPGAPSESPFGSINVNLSPLTTGTSTKTDPTGQFCPGQTGTGASGFKGCFGNATCRTITETGTPAGSIPIATPTAVILASTFCVPGTSNISVNIVGDLPGPGATAIAGVFRTN